MKNLYWWFRGLSKRIQDSAVFSMSVVGFISTFFSVLGISLEDILKGTVWIRVASVIIVSVILALGYYIIIGMVYKDSVTLTIAQTPVEISTGDLFADNDEWKVIGCDTHFNTRVDDVVISKKSLHGKLVLEHGREDEIKKVVEDAANKLGLKPDSEGLYTFPLGTIIKYDSSADNNTYLMLAMTELNAQYEAHTNMAKYEHMLMTMWKEIDRVYASYDIVLPILGAGISRFDDGPKNPEALLRCMLCTFNSSGVSFNSKVKIVVCKNSEDIPLYEYKNIFNIISKR